MQGGDDPDNRRDFPGGFAGDPRNAFDKSGRTPEEQRMYEWTRDLLRLRREHSAVRRGSLTDLHFDEDSYAYARRDDAETIVVALNRAAASKEISVPANYLGALDGSRLSPLLGAKDSPTAAGGTFKFNVPARSAVFYKLSAR
jgi:glycosidase